MARNYAPILITIWNDPDFTSLSAHAQRMFFLVNSQGSTNPAGVTIVSHKRWARLASDTDAEDVAAALGELEEAGLVIYDDDTDELWIKGFIKHNGVTTNRHHLAAMIKHYEQVASPRIRDAIAKTYPDALGKPPTNAPTDTPGNTLGRASVRRDGNAPAKPPAKPSGSCSGSVVVSSPTHSPPQDEDEFVEQSVKQVVAKLERDLKPRNPSGWRPAVTRDRRTQHADELADLHAKYPDLTPAEAAAKVLGGALPARLRSFSPDPTPRDPEAKSKLRQVREEVGA